ncbi:EF-hand domain pair [Desulfocurvibacter africanus PCS]|uniref:EF-hand domain pair n=1 Tax=Desulfocurvibacter africanus PCS TaxID=1262666 RepID=M5Q156_DESAF|nr:EF-hand domain-containing protein [Desulfocurvibacter africanus]EMG37281.1 EF-hand domain pair [Desulfocurvibacter africanus PCS]
MKYRILIAGLLALLVAMPAMAQQTTYQDPQQGSPGSHEGHVMDRAFGDVDRNGDGVISQDELREVYGEGSSERAFSEMDRDADGVLSEQEYMLPGNTGDVVSPGENPYEPLNPGESGVEPLPQADEYGITREQGTTGGVSPMDDSEGDTLDQPRAEQETERAAEDETDMRVSPYGSQEERGPENYDLNGEMGDQEGRGPAEVPTGESYGSPDYDTTPEYGTPPAGAQGGSGNIDQQGDPRATEVPEN